MGADSIHYVDWLVVAAYLAATLAIGVWFGRGKSSAEGFLLGQRSLSTWMLLLSIVATETSTVTFLSLPGLSFKEGGNLTFLQIAFGYIIGRVLVANLLMPLFFSGRFFTAYEVLQERYGSRVRLVASAVFLVMRTLADGFRLYLTALLVESATGFDFSACVLLMAAATAAYSAVGGVASVVVNDCVQFIMYTLGAVIVLAFVVSAVPEGAGGLREFAASTGRLKLLDFDLSFFAPSITLLSGVIGGGVLTMATHGADQLMVQRYLCAKSRQSAATALVLSGPLVFLQFALFLAIGVALAGFYASAEVDYTVTAPDQALMAYVVHEVPAGLRGLVIASVLAASMSTLSSSLNASAGVLVKDVSKLLGFDHNDRRELAMARAATLLFAVLQSAVAIVGYHFLRGSSVINDVLAIAGFSAGLVLGLYALGLVVGRSSDFAGLAGFAAGLAACCVAKFQLGVSWAWFSLIGAATTFAVGYCVHSAFPRSEARP